ncbi:Anamorsin homolog (Fe-S cluster assembly protein DRE2 homolog) [Durusdinium trenchii]|uniref:Anamorsin homolog n=1 Tax=Durusdinium trenchii TaxID=1381693 RepID=A0ABP0NS74_9DINO
MALLSGLFRTQGRVLVVVSSKDPAAHKAEAYWRSLPLGVATMVSPEELSKARGDYGVVFAFTSDPKYFTLDSNFLQLCLSKLRPGGHVIARAKMMEQEVSKLDTVGLFAGAVDTLFDVSGASPLVEVDFTCSKPTWASAAPIGAATIDEDTLLEDVPAPVGKGKSDCSSQPKACANCSCGRKELEDKFGAEEAKKRLEQGKERSSCGSCYLGDAFRCETCPYRGLPAFKPGSKVELATGETLGTGQLDLRVADESVEGELHFA